MQDVPPQQNCFDCGVYICEFVRRLALPSALALNIQSFPPILRCTQFEISSIRAKHFHTLTQEFNILCELHDSGMEMCESAHAEPGEHTALLSQEHPSAPATTTATVELPQIEHAISAQTPNPNQSLHSGQLFSSWDEVCGVIQSYACKQGFATTMRNTQKFLGEYVKATFVCSRSGTYVPEGKGKRQTMTSKCECPFQVSMTLLFF
jgi:hypothetical protein